MGIGAGIFLIALGAILTFALDWTVAGLDMHIIGWILMAAGVLGLILFFVFWNRRRAPATAAQEPQLREPQ
jgi:Na+/proline symporter